VHSFYHTPNSKDGRDQIINDKKVFERFREKETPYMLATCPQTMLYYSRITFLKTLL
jgi:hypothetical protein